MPVSTQLQEGEGVFLVPPGRQGRGHRRRRLLGTTVLSAVVAATCVIAAVVPYTYLATHRAVHDVAPVELFFLDPSDPAQAERGHAVSFTFVVRNLGSQRRDQRYVVFSGRNNRHRTVEATRTLDLGPGAQSSITETVRLPASGRTQVTVRLLGSGASIHFWTLGAESLEVRASRAEGRP